LITAADSAAGITAETVAIVRPRDGGIDRLERDSLLGHLGFLLEGLSTRFPDLPAAVVREQALDVLCLVVPERVTAALVARVIEARLRAMQ
jgi:hypothetical protein